MMFRTVKSPRTMLSAIALLVAVIVATGLPALANQVHPICATQQHDCGVAARITTCCCSDEGDAANPGGPAESTVQLNASLTPVPAAFATAAFPDLCRTMVRPHTSPPCSGPVDLPTLFASLLI